MCLCVCVGGGVAFRPKASIFARIPSPLLFYEPTTYRNDTEGSSVDHSARFALPLRQGHLEFSICDIQDLDDPDGVPTQECFNLHPLTRAADDGGASPIDPNYPGRYYVDPPCRYDELPKLEEKEMYVPDGSYPFKARYQLPDDLECEHCILQMHLCECR